MYNKGLIAKLPYGGRETSYFIEILGYPVEKDFGKVKQQGL